MRRLPISPDSIGPFLSTHYGIEDMRAASEMAGETDHSIRVEFGSGAVYVLKVSGPGRAVSEIELELAVLAHLAHRDIGVLVSRVVPTALGAPSAELVGRTAWLLTWVPGRPWRDVGGPSARLHRDLGALAARLGSALADFHHVGVHRSHLWDLRGASAVIGAGLPFIGDAEQREVLAEACSRFVTALETVDEPLPTTVAHQDLNDFNVLVDRDRDGAWRLSGLIDVGDTLAAVRVAELAVAVANALFGRQDPLTVAVDVAAGFDAVVSLTDAELSVLLPLVIARLGMSLAIWTRRWATADNADYASDRVQFIWPALRAISAVDPAYALVRMRQALGRYCRVTRPSPFTTSVVAAGTIPVFVDLSPTGNSDVEPFPAMGRERQVVARHGEARLARAARRTASEEPATVHLGIDLFLDEGTEIFAPFTGPALRVTDNTVVLGQPGGVRVIFAGLAPAVVPGERIGEGSTLGRVAGWPCDAKTPAHVHVQIAAVDSGLPPTFAPPSEAAAWGVLSPDPFPLLYPAEAGNSEPASYDALLVRQTHFARSQRAYYQQPMTLARAAGVWFTDEQGYRYLDAVNNVTHVGHGHPRVVAAAQRQMHRLNTNSRFVYPELSRYAERLVATLPPGLDVVFMVCTGSEANDLALRIARTVTGRADVVVIDGAYHGNTTAVTAISPYRYNGPGGSGRPPTTWAVPTPDRYRGPYGYDDPSSGTKYTAEAVTVIETMTAAGRNPAAVFAESLMGTAGQIVHPKDYLAGLFAAVRAAGGVCISDEIQVGFGRLGGAFWGFELSDVVPDIVTIGKPIGNGYPLAAVVTTRDIADAFDSGMKYFNTFGGNPVSCAVGLSVLDVIADEGLQQQAADVGGYFRQMLESLRERHRFVGDVRGEGLYLGIELVSDVALKTPAKVAAYEISERMRDEGVIIWPNGVYENVLKIKPPMIFRREHAELVTDALDRILIAGW